MYTSAHVKTFGLALYREVCCTLQNKSYLISIFPTGFLMQRRTPVRNWTEVQVGKNHFKVPVPGLLNELPVDRMSSVLGTIVM